MTSNPICDVSATTMSSSSDGGSVSLSEACVSDADCGRLGLCRTGVCDCPSAFYGTHCQIDPYICVPGFKGFFYFHVAFFLALYLALFVMFARRIWKTRSSFKELRKLQVKDANILLLTLATFLRLFYLAVDPYRQYGLLDLYGEAALGFAPLVIIIVVFGQLTLLWVRIYRVSRRNLKPMRVRRILTLIFSFIVIIVLMVFVEISVANQQPVYTIVVAGCFLVSIVAWIAFTVPTALLTIRFMRKSTLAPALKVSVKKIAGGLLLGCLSCTMLMIALIIFTMKTEEINGDALWWLTFRTIFAFFEIGLFAAVLWVASYTGRKLGRSSPPAELLQTASTNTNTNTNTKSDSSTSSSVSSTTGDERTSSTPEKEKKSSTTEKEKKKPKPKHTQERAENPSHEGSTESPTISSTLSTLTTSVYTSSEERSSS